MVTGLPKERLLALLNRLKSAPLCTDEAETVISYIDGVVSVYLDNRNRPSELGRAEARKRLKNYRNALQEMLKSAKECEFAFPELAQTAQIRTAATPILAMLESMLGQKSGKGPTADDRIWAINALANIFESETGQKPTISYRDTDPPSFSSDFFDFAWLCFSNMDPYPFASENALGGAIRDALKLRGKHDPLTGYRGEKE